jgi:ribose-phosphate pyrophosphokinase
VVDDLISSGGTMLRAAQALREHGAGAVIAVAAHGLFTGDAADVVMRPEIGRWLVTDSIPPFRLPAELAARRIEVVSAVPLLAEAIARLHADRSLVELAGDQD